MKSSRSFATTSFAGVVLGLTIATGAAPSLSCVACEVSTSYHAALRAYDRARAWGTIVRWWVDPDYSTPHGQARNDRQPSPRTEDLCQARPVPVRMR
jgi:hypothetical protein